MAAIKLSSGYKFFQNEISKVSQYFSVVFDKPIIPLVLVGCEMIIYSQHGAMRLIAYNSWVAHLWNNCKLDYKYSLVFLGIVKH